MVKILTNECRTSKALVQLLIKEKREMIDKQKNTFIHVYTKQPFSVAGLNLLSCQISFNSFLNIGTVSQFTI